MSDSSPSDHVINVLTFPHAGQLDPAGREATHHDLQVIREYISAENHARVILGERKAPSIERAVLTTVWEKPRTAFHSKQKKLIGDFEFGSKLLLIPWSMEAYSSLHEKNSVKGLLLEHVTPLSFMWKELVKIDSESPTEDDWFVEAEGYLNNHYRLAVLTTAQAAAIDRAGHRQKGTPGNPFFRYQKAIESPRFNVSLDLDKFVQPGVLEDVHVDLRPLEEESDESELD